MATSRLRVIIDASAKAAVDAFKQVGNAANQMADNTTKAGAITQGAFTGLGRVIGATTKAVAVGWTVAAAAVATTAVSAFRTGVEFNTLQQKANASFTTILGSAEAADKMMESISKFADTSPFPRQVFIQAAQQMTAFGVESDKVVPIMSAVQDAVAAAGGSSQDLQDIIFVMSQIKAAGKITGQDLIQFGQRGIDAAGLIGKSLGKSGAEIRDSITKGTLGADDAIDALTKGMAAKFGGAAENVKKTWVGTKDSVNAAIRDIGAAMAEPFVSAKGGGMFVDWGNQVAEILRSVRDIVREIMPQLVQYFGSSLGSVGDILGKVSTALGKVDLSKVMGAFEKFAPVLGTLTGAFAAMSGGMLRQIPIIGNLLGGLAGPFGVVALAIAGLVATSPDLQKAFGSTLAQVFEAIQPAISAIGDALLTLVPALSDVIKAVLPLLPAIATLASNFLTALLPPLLTIVNAALPPLIAGLTWVSNALAAVASNQTVGTVLAGIALSLLAIGAASKAVGSVNAVLSILRARAVGTAIGLAALKVKSVAMAAASKVAAAAQWLWNAAMSANPIMLVILAIAALVTAIVLLWHNSEAFRNFWIGAWNVIKSVALAVWDGIKTAAAAAFNWIKSNWPLLVAILAGPIGAAVVLIVKNWDTIRSVAVAVWNAVAGAATAAFRGIMAAANAVWSVLTAIWNILGATGTAVWNGIRTAAVAVFNVIRGVASVVFAAISAYLRAWLAVARVVFNAVRTVATAVFNAVRAVIAAVMGAAKSYLSGMLAVARSVFAAVRSVASVAFNAVRSVVSSVVGAVKTVIRGISATASSVFGAVRSTASSVFGAIRSIVSGAVGGIKATIRTITAVFSSVFSGAKSAASGAMGAIRSIVSSVVGGIKRIIEGITSTFRSAFDKAASIARSALNTIMGPINTVKDALSGIMSFVDKVKSAIGRIKVPGILKKVLGRSAPAAAAAPSSATMYGARAMTAGNTNYARATGSLNNAVSGLMSQVSALGSTFRGGDVRVINVTVSGALDPVAVARQIDSVLTRAERRNRGVSVGGRGNLR